MRLISHTEDTLRILSGTGGLAALKQAKPLKPVGPNVYAGDGSLRDPRRRRQLVQEHLGT